MREKIGKYHVVDVAGQGNMGTVYVGYDPFADRDVALKICSLGRQLSAKSNRVARKLFFNEAHMAGVLDHPNILRILDAGEVDGDPYVVMEYVDGGRTLTDHCDIDSTLPIEAVAQYVAKCGAALDYAHRRGVIHRDIKPSNIMLTPEGDVKIGDFGIAVRALDDTTHVLGLIGSPRYMSPEQVEEQELSGQTDIYSLGVVLYEMLCGCPPFDATNLARLIEQIQHAEPPSLRQLRPELPEALDDIVRRAMHKDRLIRYQTGSEFARDLMALFGRQQTASNGDLVGTRGFDLLRGLSFFNDFADHELRELISHCALNEFGPGTAINVPAGTEYSFFVLLSGDLSVSRGGRRVAALGSGHCFGMFAAQNDAEQTVFTALNHLRLLTIDAEQLEHTSDSCQLRFNKVFLRSILARLETRSNGLTPMLWREAPQAERAA